MTVRANADAKEEDRLPESEILGQMRRVISFPLLERRFDLTRA